MMGSYLIRHVQVFLATIGDLFRSPISTLMNAAVIGITLSIPVIGLSLVDSAESLNQTWDSKPQINVYLQAKLDDTDIKAITEELKFTVGIDQSKLISKEQALEDFKRMSGLQDELASLDDNPLPTTLIVIPTEDYSTAEGLEELGRALQKIDGIAEISMNTEWIKRFNAIVRFIRSLTIIVGVLLATAIVLVTSNTVRLLIMDRKQEIVITKLVGGTNAFIRRPFLYFGLLLGTLGGLLACLFHVGTHTILNQPLQQLATSYNTELSLAALSWQQFGLTLLTGALLGWLAARISVARHLTAIRPR